MSFHTNFTTGRVAESMIARWMMRRGFCVLPVYELAEQRYKGPQLFSCDGEFIAPDMLALKIGGPILFVEAKCKSGFTWSRKYCRFETGIDWAHYQDYQAVAKKTGLPLWILFLQQGGAVKDAPPNKPDSPRGLYGNEIQKLMDGESHRHDGWGKGGMVYWSPDYPSRNPALRLIAGYEDIYDIANRPSDYNPLLDDTTYLTKDAPKLIVSSRIEPPSGPSPIVRRQRSKRAKIDSKYGVQLSFL